MKYSLLLLFDSLILPRTAPHSVSVRLARPHDDRPPALGGGAGPYVPGRPADLGGWQPCIE